MNEMRRILDVLRVMAAQGDILNEQAFDEYDLIRKISSVQGLINQGAFEGEKEAAKEALARLIITAKKALPGFSRERKQKFLSKLREVTGLELEPPEPEPKRASPASNTVQRYQPYSGWRLPPLPAGGTYVFNPSYFLPSGEKYDPNLARKMKIAYQNIPGSLPLNFLLKTPNGGNLALLINPAYVTDVSLMRRVEQTYERMTLPKDVILPVTREELPEWLSSSPFRRWRDQLGSRWDSGDERPPSLRLV